MVAKLVALGHDPRDVRQAADKWRCHPNIFDSMRQLSDSSESTTVLMPSKVLIFNSITLMPD